MMKSRNRLARVLTAVCGLACVVAIGARADAVTIGVASPPPVKSPGDTARVCVWLDAGADEVAGTMNDLQWDGSCASMVDPCVANPSHGKNLNAAQQTATSMRAIILSLSDVNPIDSGELYCCTFRVDVENPGSCCSITLSNAQSSTPDGKALTTVSRGGQVCLASGPAGAGRMQPGSRGEPAGVIGADLGTGARQAAPESAPAAAAPKGGPIGAAPPAVVVPPLGEEPEEGERAPAGAEEPAAVRREPAAPAPVARAPGEPAAPAEERVPGVATTPGTPTAEVAKPTPDKAAPTVGEATAKVAAKATPAPVRAAVPTTAAGGGSGCNCQIGAGGFDGSSFAWLAMLVVLLVGRRRKI